MTGLSYKQSGVDLDVYAESMKRLPRLMHRTFSPRVRQLDGGFAGLFQLDFDNHLFRRNYRNPMLVACTDGVGSKLKVAQDAGRHDTVGIDLVGMCVNDAICCGAEPLFFLDYIAMGRDDPESLERIVSGISNGCIEADCALLGGETAIMPDQFAAEEYELAGFCVGVVEKANLITGQNIAAGDVVIGIESNGLHSNGYTLARMAVLNAGGKRLDEPFNAYESVAEALLRPTCIYVSAIRDVLRHYRVKSVIHGIAHITGGGLAENIERILSTDVSIEIDVANWPRPAIFDWVQELGGIETGEMFRVFNMGIGIVLIASPYYADSICRIASAHKMPAHIIGSVTEGDRSVNLINA